MKRTIDDVWLAAVNTDEEAQDAARATGNGRLIIKVSRGLALGLPERRLASLALTRADSCRRAACQQETR